MVKGSYILASLLALGLLSTAPPLHAKESLQEAIEREVPVHKDGTTRLSVADIERAIIAACERNKFRASVVAPGVIKARRRWSTSIVVMIPYSDEGFSIQPGKARGRVSYEEHVAGLAEYIEADLARELVRVKSLQKPLMRSPRIRPRTAA
jgi:hypothetical protein